MCLQRAIEVLTFISSVKVTFSTVYLSDTIGISAPVCCPTAFSSSADESPDLGLFDRRGKSTRLLLYARSRLAFNCADCKSFQLGSKYVTAHIKSTLSAAHIMLLHVASPKQADIRILGECLNTSYVLCVYD